MMLALFFIFAPVFGYHSFFNHWHCIQICDRLSDPYTTHVGTLPLVVWRNEEHRLVSAINICPHMGSELGNAKRQSDGCLQCQYHGLKLSGKHYFGQLVEFEDKVFWSYEPARATPFATPFYNNPKYVHSHIVVDMDAELQDCALNTMDVRHPEFVHGGVFGFGSNVAPTAMKSHKIHQGVGLEFEYTSNRITQQFNRYAKSTHNYHMYHYPFFTWSKVSFAGKNLVISVNLHPLSASKTRWFVAVCHDYYTDKQGKVAMNLLARKILFDDLMQMKNQASSSPLKREVLFNHVFQDEEVVLDLKDLFSEYKYPDSTDVLELYRHHNKKTV
jgi:phenylpropionate dioxygenase-like ring-hydroxylating dioxygenase large terminal subunit